MGGFGRLVSRMSLNIIVINTCFGSRELPGKWFKIDRIASLKPNTESDRSRTIDLGIPWVALQ